MVEAQTPKLFPHNHFDKRSKCKSVAGFVLQFFLPKFVGGYQDGKQSVPLSKPSIAPTGFAFVELFIV
jgi:hypothetical protein